MTYSIVARDPDTGAVGVAVQTHQPSVGALCPFAEPGVGAVATQAFVDPTYGPRGLTAMRNGEAAADALARLLADDDLREIRQVAFVDAAGHVAVHTGSGCVAHAAHVVGEGYSCQANMMRGPGVPEAMASAYEAATASGDRFAHRLLAALDAAEEAGGDIRGMQSAAIAVRGPDPSVFFSAGFLDRRVDDHAQPLVELRRLVDLDRDNPEGWFWDGINTALAGDIDAGAALVAKAFAADDSWRELLSRLPPSGRFPDNPEVFDRLRSL